MFAKLDSPKAQIKLLVIFSALFWFGLSNGVVATLFILNDLHATPAQLSFTVTLGIALGLVMDVPTSALADRYNRKIVLVLSAIFGVIGIVVTAISTQFVILLIASVAFGIRKALREGVVEAMIYDHIHVGGYQKKYHYIMSRFGILGLIGSTAAPFLGGLLASQWGARTVIWIDVIPLSLLLLFAIFLLREPKRHYQKTDLRLDKHIHESLKLIPRSAVLTYYFMFNLFLWTYATLFNSFSSLYFVSLGFDPVILGTFSAISAGCVMLGHIVFRKHEIVPTYPIFALGACLALAMLVPNPLISSICFFAQAFLMGALTAVFDREKQLAIPDHARSTILSTFGLSVQIAFVGLSFLFGWIANMSVRAAFLLVGGSALVGLVWTMQRHKKILRAVARAQ